MQMIRIINNDDFSKQRHQGFAAPRHPEIEPMNFDELDVLFSAVCLPLSGRLVVDSIRRVQVDDAAMRRDFAELLGPKAGRSAYLVFHQIAHGLFHHGHRPIQVGDSDWPALTPDEVALLQCVEAAQRRQAKAVDAHASWLVRSAGRRAFKSNLRVFASILRLNGFVLETVELNEKVSAENRLRSAAWAAAQRVRVVRRA